MHPRFEIARYDIQIVRGLRTNELESPWTPISILNINYLGDRVEAGSFTRASTRDRVEFVPTICIYIYIYTPVLKFSQSSGALGRGNGNARAYICS